jgi:hypothetical protein
LTRLIRSRLALLLAATTVIASTCLVSALAIATPVAGADTVYCQRWVPAYTDCANTGGGSSTYANGIWDENVNEGYYFQSSWAVCEKTYYGSSLISSHCGTGAIGSGSDLCGWYDDGFVTSAHAINDASSQEFPVGQAYNLGYSQWCG